MSTLDNIIETPRIKSVTVLSNLLAVDFESGESVKLDMRRFPRLLSATPAEREHFRIIGHGRGVCWDDIDEDLSAVGLLQGTPAHIARPGRAVTTPQ